MLFAIKNRLGPSLLLLLVLAGGSWLGHRAFRLPWQLAPSPGLLAKVAFGLGLILASDGLVHAALTLRLGARYRIRYHALAEFFHPQGPLEIVGAGLLAGGEELFFRGLLLEGLLRAGLVPAIGIGLTALAFGAAHRLRAPRLAPYALWAVWEGVLLSVIYLAIGSLLAQVIVHALHDVIGFSLLATARRKPHGWSSSIPSEGNRRSKE